ncbi:MAG TPA: biotin--[acetyl-CoA-carboxylase] ligase, partial [Microbacterium sp.]|nr:biotin--[acetyl-CoA-carboxylase] ligase [Microbacterium sp.]
MQAGDFPRAAIIAGRLDVVPYTGSTNADLLAAVAVEPDAYPHLSVLVTDDQRAGRGRLDRTWTAPAGAALAISVLVRVSGIPADQRGWVPLIAGAAMTRALRGQFAPDAAEGGPRVGLKWPNDVL